MTRLLLSLIALCILAMPAFAKTPNGMVNTPETKAIGARVKSYTDWLEAKEKAIPENRPFEKLTYTAAGMLLLSIDMSVSMGKISPQQATWFLDNFQKLGADGDISDKDLEAMNAMTKQLKLG